MNGRPRPAFYAADLAHAFVHARVPSAVTVVIALAGSAFILATAGTALTQQQEVIDRMNSPANRLITVTDPGGAAGITPRSVDAVRSLAGVEWVLGVGPASDFHATANPERGSVPGREVYGDLPEVVAVDTPDALSPSDALTGPGVAERLGLADGFGPVESSRVGVIVRGGFSATEPMAFLNEGILVMGSDESARLNGLWIGVEDVAYLDAMSSLAPSVLVAVAPERAVVNAPDELATLSADVVDSLRSGTQRTVGAAAAAIVALVAVTQFGRVASMARDVGRDRALGASRSAIVMSVLAQSVAMSAVGAVTGVLAGVGIVWTVAGSTPTVSFAVAVGVLVVLASALGSVPPAIRAARLDPVAILRVP